MKLEGSHLDNSKLSENINKKKKPKPVLQLLRKISKLHKRKSVSGEKQRSKERVPGSREYLMAIA